MAQRPTQERIGDLTPSNALGRGESSPSLGADWTVHSCEDCKDMFELREDAFEMIGEDRKLGTFVSRNLLRDSPCPLHSHLVGISGASSEITNVNCDIVLPVGIQNTSSGFAVFEPERDDFPSSTLFLSDVPPSEFPAWYAGGNSATSEGLYDRVANWITECRSTHTLCRKADPEFVPSRLIRISPDNSLRLIHTEPGDCDIAWCCLSYVWGGPQPLLTTKASLQSHLIAIDTADLPQTITDAIVVCRRLGFEYLWVDSLCILQDDIADKDRELSGMYKVYRNADLTISAASAASVRDGFLSPRTFNHKMYPCVALPLYSEDGKGIFVYFLLQGWAEYEAPTPPSDTRGWIFQEMILSRRRLQFCHDSVIWNCHCASGENNFMAFKNLTQHLYSYLMKRDWREIIQEYTRDRQLGLPEDKLAAISAIAMVHTKSARKTYIAGLWKEDLPIDLCWWVQGPPPKLGSTRYRAPSWSWASVDGPIFFKDAYLSHMSHSVAEDKPRVIDVTVIPARLGTEYTQLESASLVLMGALGLRADLEDLIADRVPAGDVNPDGPEGIKNGWLSTQYDTHKATRGVEFVAWIFKTSIDFTYERVGLVLNRVSQNTFTRVGLTVWHTSERDTFAGYKTYVDHLAHELPGFSLEEFVIV